MEVQEQHRHALPIGLQLNEYKIEAILGKSGGFGITYLATDTNLSQSVAIKEYLPSDFAVREGISTVYVRSSADEDAFKWGLNRFLEEARVLARFDHPNIVRVLRFFEANGTAYMVMEYQSGKSLAEFLKQETLTEEKLLNLLLPLLEGLKEIHDKGFLHRDIKPTNIYIRYDLKPVLLDFGSARYAIGQKSQAVTSIVTPGYAPLEQYDNELGEQGPWTDIYALGGVMYFAISGEVPPAATRRIMKDPLIPATQIGAGKYSKNLLASIDWALALNKEDRPQSIEEWRKKLILPDSMPNSYHVPLSQHWQNTSVTTVTSSLLSQFSKSQRWFVSAAGVVIMLLFMATGSVVLYQGKEIAREHLLYSEAQKQADTFKRQTEDLKKLLEVEQQRREYEEKMRQQAEEAIKEIRRFEDQTVALEQKKFNDNYTTPNPLTNKYYAVTEVEPDDTLNLRAFPGHLNDVIGKIPHDEKCLLYLSKLHILQSRKSGRSNVWVMVRYKEMQGWVNSRFLVENKQCN